MDEQFRETCDRFIRAEAGENALHRINAELTQPNGELLSENLKKDAEIADKDATIAELAAENARLKALLATNSNKTKK